MQTSGQGVNWRVWTGRALSGLATAFRGVS